MTQAVTLSHPYTSPTITVEIHSATVKEHIEDQKPVKVPLPIIKEEQDTTAPSTLLYPMKRMLHTITVTGFLVTDSTSTALQKKEALISTTVLSGSHPEAPSSLGILNKSGEIKLTWKTEELKLIFDNIDFTDSAARLQTSGLEKYDVIINFTLGEVL